MKARSDVQLQVVAAASALSDSYGNVAGVMAAEGFAPDATVDSLGRGAAGRWTRPKPPQDGLSLTVTGAESHLVPDVVVTIADRYETLATAVAAVLYEHPAGPSAGRAR